MRAEFCPGLDDYVDRVEQIARRACEPVSFRETRPPRRYFDNRVINGTNNMSERFTETLRAASEPGWSDAVGHRFVKELFAGTIPNAVMARYLIQDHRFLDSFLILLGAALRQRRHIPGQASLRPFHRHGV